MPPIETRRELARHLQAQMAAARGSWFAEEHTEEAAGRNSLKTYLLEAHCVSAPQARLELLADVGEKIGFRVTSTSEDDLLHIEQDGSDFWCDTSLGRFWRLHTVARVNAADALRKALVTGVRWLDSVWLPPDYLEGLAMKVGARMLTFSLNHDRRPLTRAEGLSVPNFVTLRLWASQAAETLAKLRETNVFPHGVSVRSIKLHAGDEDSNGDYCVAEYFRSGKVTASGTSFDLHSHALVQIIRDYAALVEGIEDEYGLRFESGGEGGPRIHGNPITLRVEWTIDDLEYAVDRIFSAADPFRLWAVPSRIAANHYRARAVDMHMGGVLTFDLTDKWISVQLPGGVCGNTVVRFLNGIRCHVNADAEMVR